MINRIVEREKLIEHIEKEQKVKYFIYISVKNERRNKVVHVSLQKSFKRSSQSRSRTKPTCAGRKRKIMENEKGSLGQRTGRNFSFFLSSHFQVWSIREVFGIDNKEIFK